MHRVCQVKGKVAKCLFYNKLKNIERWRFSSIYDFLVKNTMYVDSMNGIFSIKVGKTS